jgi:hypothetical protein
MFMSMAGQHPGTEGVVRTARAVVSPIHARTTFENDNNISAGARAATELQVVVRPDAESGAHPDPAQRIVTRVPNWLRIVFYYAGSNDGPWADLPAEVEVVVQLDRTTGRVVDVDIDRAATELAAYRDVATRWWKESEAPLADVRGLLSAPRDAVRGIRGLASSWRRTAARLRTGDSDLGPGAEGVASLDVVEQAQLDRTANLLSHRLTGDPKALRKVRASAMEAGPMLATNVRFGSMSLADFDTWLRLQVGSGAITDGEAAAWRTDATTP